MMRHHYSSRRRWQSQRDERSCLEKVLGVEQAGVDLCGCLVAEADDKDLCRGVSRCGRLGGLHLVEQLLERVQQRIVILGPENK